jgi:hypothetical protein
LKRVASQDCNDATILRVAVHPGSSNGGFGGSLSIVGYQFGVLSTVLFGSSWAGRFVGAALYSFGYG